MQTAPILDLDTATRIDIANVYAGWPWPLIKMKMFEDDNTTPISMEGDWEFVLARDINFTDVVSTLTNSTGISVNENELAVQFTDVAPAAGKYYFKLGREFLEYYGEVPINHKGGKWR